MAAHAAWAAHHRRHGHARRSRRANQAVTVTATVTGQTSVVVRYQIDFTGQQTVADDRPRRRRASRATIPGAAAGHLIRYRVEATNAAGTNYSPRLDDSSPYKGVVVANGITSAIAVVEWFIPDADYNLITPEPDARHRRGRACSRTTASVTDNAMFSIRGESHPDQPQGQLEVRDAAGPRPGHPARHDRRRSTSSR